MLLLPAAVRGGSIQGILNRKHPAIAICGSRPYVGCPEAEHPTASMTLRDQVRG